MNPAKIALAVRKLYGAVRLARQASRDSWQHSRSTAEAKEYRRISREAMQDARYWKQELGQ